MGKQTAVRAIVGSAAVVALAVVAGAAWAVPQPTPTITAKPSALSTDKTPTFSFQTDDDKQKFMCSVDGENAKDCDSPYTTKSLDDGPHTFSVVAVDKDNTSDPATYSWTIDAAAPKVTISSGPPSHSGSRSASFDFESDESGSTFECALDDADFSACVSPQAYSGLDDGAHSFKVRATDLAGNTSDTETYSWTIDAVPPTVTITSGPPVTSSSSSASFTFSSADAGATFLCALDGAAFASCTSPHDYAGLADGDRTFTVEASDAKGKIGAPASYSWTISSLVITVVDTTPPHVVGALHARVKYKDALLSWRVPADADFDHVTVSRVTGNGSRWVTKYTGANTTYDDKSVNNGVDQRYSVVAFDHAGNASTAMLASAPASALLLSPKRGARVSVSSKRLSSLSSQPVLVWTQIRGARFYNVQLFKGNRKVLSRWPRSSRLSLPSRWTYEKHHYTLSHGVYRWYVWPELSARYGALEGQSSFRVG